MRWPVVAAITAVLALSACGGGSDTAKPQVTVTKPAPAPVTVTTTQTEQATEEVTPPSCLAALDAANQVAVDSAAFGNIVADMASALPKAITAAFNRDVAGITAATARQKVINTRLDALNDRIGPHVDEYNSQAEMCRASAP